MNNKIMCTITPKSPLYGILAGPIRKKTDLELNKEQIIRCINNNAIITTNIEGKSVRISINNAAEILEKALSTGISKPITPAFREDDKLEESVADKVENVLVEGVKDPSNEAISGYVATVEPDVKTPEPEKKEDVKQPEPEKKEDAKPETPAPAQDVKKDNKPFDKKKNKQGKKNEQYSEEETYTEADAEKYLADTLEEIEIQEMIDKDKK